jgi:hypothetical protein
MGPNAIRIVLSYLRTVDAKAHRSVLYHGTSKEVGRRILSEGLVPRPKKRVWDVDPDAKFGHLPRTSFPGTYLTGNLMTAISSATTAGGPQRERTIVVVDVEEDSLVHDEDTITISLRDVLRDFVPKGWLVTEHSILDIYDEMSKGDLDDRIKKAAEDFLKSVDVQAQAGYGGEKVPVAEKAIKDLITREAAHGLVASTWYSNEKSWEQMKEEQKDKGRDVSSLPDPASADRDFMSSLEALTDKLKPRHARGLAADTFMDTSRIREPVGFSGSNRIVAVVGVGQDFEHAGKPYTIKFYYGNPNDKRLSDFYHQFKERMTDSYIVYDRQGNVVEYLSTALEPEVVHA